MLKADSIFLPRPLTFPLSPEKRIRFFKVNNNYPPAIQEILPY